MNKDIVVLISGSGSNLESILHKCKEGYIGGQVVLVGSDNKEAYGLEIAKRYGVDTFTVEYEGRNRKDVEIELYNYLPDNFALIALAGFMKVLSPDFVNKINTKDSTVPRIMNIHPSLLPAFPGTDGYGDTFRYGCKVGGCTVHFVDEGVDTGSIIGQRTYTIEDDDTIESIKSRGLAIEWELYPECIRSYLLGELFIDGRTVRRWINV